MKKLIIKFEDQGQDCTQFTVEFDEHYSLGYIRESDAQMAMWTKLCVLSGKPEIGQHMTLSQAPGEPCITYKYKITSIEEAK